MRVIIILTSSISISGKVSSLFGQQMADSVIPQGIDGGICISREIFEPVLAIKPIVRMYD